MSDAPLIYLSTSRAASAETPAYWQHARHAAVSQGTLGEALDAFAGGPVELVIGSADALLTSVTLSRKQARHLQRVLPYLLEEQLLDSLDAVWLAAGKASDSDYPVVVISRAEMTSLLAQVQSAGCRLQSLKVDADLLAGHAPLQVRLAEQTLLLATRTESLSVDSAHSEQLAGLFGDTLGDATQVDDVDALFDLFRQSQESPAVELLQGEFAPRVDRKASASPWAPWKPLMGLAAAVFMVALVALWVQQWRYQKASDEAFAQAKSRYESLFPGDRATAALKRQFQARLARLGGGEGAGADFLTLLTPVAQVLHDNKIDAKRFQYDQRSGALLLDVGAKDYSQLETLQNAIRKQGVDANIANYRNGASGVSARIKVEQAG
ncbi:MAG: type II secretion system protein GspL [Alcanivorax sp.]|nr:type II secretion system protein GspL [Alcanivorax sp.]